MSADDIIKFTGLRAKIKCLSFFDRRRKKVEKPINWQKPGQCVDRLNT